MKLLMLVGVLFFTAALAA